MSAFLDETVLSVHHWTDRLFSFTTTRDQALRFSNGHFTMIGLRQDNGKPLLRATNSGVTIAFDSKGNTVGQIPQFKEQVLRVSVAPAKGVTPYTRIGSWPLLAWVFTTLLFGLWRQRLKNTNKIK